MIYSTHEWTTISLQRNVIQRSYEPVQIYFFTALARAMGVRSFWDVGSNIGTFSVAMAEVPTIKVIHAFEPMPQLHLELATNVRSNDLAGKILCHQVAISDHEGPVEFGVIGAYSGANGVAATLLHDHDRITQYLQVQAQTLDTFVATGCLAGEGPSAVKIDVEGHEMAVLKGATRLLRQPCVLQIEVYGQDGPEDTQIDTFLAEFGYRRFWQIGADRYFAPADLCPTSDRLLEIIGNAHQDMIADLRQLEMPSLAPADAGITRRIGPVQISLLNPVASLLRRLFRGL